MKHHVMGWAKGALRKGCNGGKYLVQKHVCVHVCACMRVFSSYQYIFHSAIWGLVWFSSIKYSIILGVCYCWWAIYLHLVCAMCYEYTFVFFFNILFEVMDQGISLARDWGNWRPIWGGVAKWGMGVWMIHGSLEPCLANFYASSLPTIYVWALILQIVMLWGEIFIVIKIWIMRSSSGWLNWEEGHIKKNKLETSNITY